MHPPTPFGAKLRIGASATVGVMAAMALYNLYRTKRSERQHPPRGRFVTIDGVQLHYLEAGSGPPVILLHGNVVSAEDFEVSRLFALLARRHRVVAFDRPGFGYSNRPYGAMWSPAAQADLLRRAWTALGIESPIVLGHSWGAMVALTAALNHPKSLRGIVLLSGYYYSSLRADTLLAAPPSIPIVGDLLRFTVSPLLSEAMLPRLFRKMFAPLAVPRSFADRFLDGLPVRPSQIRAESQDGVIMVPAASGMEHRYRELMLPVAILAGTEDQVVNTEDQAVRLHRDVPHSTLRLIPDAGHMLHHAVPEKVAEVVDEASGPASTAESRTTAYRGSPGRGTASRSGFRP
jgi:pimeloyl-ACP methyl ester carboxylesterase